MSVSQACRYLHISRQAYYQQWTRQLQRDEHEAHVLDFVRAERMLQPRIGTRKLKHLMALKQRFIGRDHLFRLLGEQRLLVPTKRAYHRTTQSHHRFHCHPHLLKTGYTATQPEQLWVADITYLPTHNGDTYVSLVTDAYSRKIVGHHIDDNIQTQSVKQAFKKALKQRMSSAR